jgi:hypothetical protein
MLAGMAGSADRRYELAEFLGGGLPLLPGDATFRGG